MADVIRWNSAFFIAIPVSQCNIAFVTSDFSEVKDLWDGVPPELDELRKQAIYGTAERLTPQDCITRYVGHKAGLKDLLVVSSNITTNDGLSLTTNSSSSILSSSSLGGGVDWAISGSWMCSARAHPGEISKTFCTEQSLLPNAANWTLFGVRFRGLNDVDKAFWSKVDHCVTAGQPRDMDDKCALRMSSAILDMVCILNLVKCVCIFLTAHHYFKDERAAKKAKSPQSTSYLVTIGDAIASFLETADQSTLDMQLLGKRDFARNKWPDSRCARQPKERRWYQAATPRRWLITASL